MLSKEPFADPLDPKHPIVKASPSTWVMTDLRGEMVYIPTRSNGFRDCIISLNEQDGTYRPVLWDLVQIEPGWWRFGVNESSPKYFDDILDARTMHGIPTIDLDTGAVVEERFVALSLAKAMSRITYPLTFRVDGAFVDTWIWDYRTGSRFKDTEWAHFYWQRACRES